MSKTNKNFWHKLLAEGETDTISHKRLVAIISLSMLIVLSLLSAFGHSAAGDYIYLFGVLTGGESMLTTIEKTAERVKKAKASIQNDNVL